MKQSEKVIIRFTKWLSRWLLIINNLSKNRSENGKKINIHQVFKKHSVHWVRIVNLTRSEMIKRIRKKLTEEILTVIQAKISQETSEKKVEYEVTKLRFSTTQWSKYYRRELSTADNLTCVNWLSSISIVMRSLATTEEEWL